MTAGEPQFLQALDYDAKQLRQMLAALTGARLHTDLSPAVSLVSAGGGHGVVGSGDLAVTEKSGTPNMSVDVAAGTAFIRGTQGADQGVYIGTNDAVVNVVIAAADATNARKDLIVAKVRDAAYSGASDDLQLTVIQGTPAASPADPTVSEDTLVLARVDVPALDTSITNSQITDLRTRAYALGGVSNVSTLSLLPNPAFQGQDAYTRDTGKSYRYTGSAWIEVGDDGAWDAFTPTIKFGATTATISANSSVYKRTGRKIDVRCSFRLSNLNGGTTSLTITRPVVGAMSSLTNNYTETMGVGGLIDVSSGGLYSLFVNANLSDGSDVHVRTSASPSVGVTHAAPVPIAVGGATVGDEFYLNYSYEAAS